jgi:hypothetical protein
VQNGEDMDMKNASLRGFALALLGISPAFAQQAA